MRRRLLGASLTAAFAISALAAPTFAHAKPNDHNCAGQHASAAGGSLGSWVSGQAKFTPGGWMVILKSDFKPGCMLP